MKAICFVAHPDDCIIFCLPFIDAHEYNWTIVYLTYTETDARAIEVRNFWNKRNIETVFLGFEDLKLYSDKNNIDFETAKASINKYDADLILTHGANGEYDHPHHVLCYNLVESFDCEKVYIADERNYNIVCNAVDVDVTEIPLHADAVKLHRRNVNRYSKVS